MVEFISLVCLMPDRQLVRPELEGRVVINRFHIRSPGAQHPDFATSETLNTLTCGFRDCGANRPGAAGAEHGLSSSTPAPGDP